LSVSSVQCAENTLCPALKVRGRRLAKTAQPLQGWASLCDEVGKCDAFDWRTCTPAGPGRQCSFLSSLGNLIQRAPRVFLSADSEKREMRAASFISTPWIRGTSQLSQVDTRLKESNKTWSIFGAVHLVASICPCEKYTLAPSQPRSTRAFPAFPNQHSQTLARLGVK
jgi:hypothetical protein